MVGVHRKKSEKEILGHGEFTFSNQRVSMSMRLGGPSGGILGSFTFSRNHSTFRDNQGRIFLIPRVTASSVISIVTRTRRRPGPKLFARLSGSTSSAVVGS